MSRQRRRTRTGHRVEMAATVVVVVLAIGVFVGVVPLVLGALFGAAAIAADLLIQ